MGLGQDTLKRIKSISYLLEGGKMNQRQFINLIHQTKGQDNELNLILMRAQAVAVKEYDNALRCRTLGEAKELCKGEGDDWFLKDFALEGREKLYDEKEYISHFLGKEISEVTKKREIELKDLEQNLSKTFEKEVGRETSREDPRKDHRKERSSRVREMFGFSR